MRRLDITRSYANGTHLSGYPNRGSAKGLQEKTMPANPTNCNVVPSACCASGYPQTLYATIATYYDPNVMPPHATPPPCDINTLVATLSYQGGELWSGTISSTNCGTLTVNFLILGINVGASCDWRVTIKSGATTCWTCRLPPKCPVSTRIFGETNCMYGNAPFGCACCPSVSLGGGNQHFTLTISE